LTLRQNFDHSAQFGGQHGVPHDIGGSENGVFL
jgi:hypothetical protein